MRKLLASLAIVGCTVTGALALVPTAAHAETMDHFTKQWDTLTADNQAVADAASAGDVSGLKAACSTQQDDTYTLQATHRPAIYPKAAWRHLMRYAALVIRADDACMAGNYDTATSLIRQGTVELTAATRAIKAVTGA